MPDNDGRYYAKGLEVHKRPRDGERTAAGKSISLGFPVLTVTEYVGEDNVQFIVDALNIHEHGEA